MSEITAIVGATTGTLALCISAYNTWHQWRRERPSLRVEAAIDDRRVPHPVPYQGLVFQLRIQVRNDGPRVHVDKIRICRSDGDTFDLPVEVPRALEHGERSSFTCDVDALIGGFDELYVVDGLGNRSDLHHVDVMRLQRDARAALAAIDSGTDEITAKEAADPALLEESRLKAPHEDNK